MVLPSVLVLRCELMSAEPLDELLGIYLQDSLDDLVQEYLPEPEATVPQAQMDQSSASHVMAPVGPAAPIIPAKVNVSEEATRLWSPSLGADSVAADAIKTALSEVIPATATEAPDIHQDLLSISKFYFGGQQTLHTSKEAIADKLQIPAEKLEPLLGLLCCCLFHADRGSQLELEKRLLQSQCRCLCFVDMNRYDETPMKVTKRGPPLRHMPWSTMEGDDGSTVPAAPFGQSHGAHRGPGTHSSSSTTTKLFASEQKFGMVLELPQAHDESEPQLVGIVGTKLGIVQMLQHNTAQNMVEALRFTYSSSEYRSKAQLQVRACCTDKHPANHLAERQLLDMLGPTWCHLQVDCQVHVLARINSKALLEFVDDLSGLANLALYLSFNENMQAFRSSLAAVIQHRLTVIRGSPPISAMEHRRWALDTFCSSGPKADIRRYLLESVANGDWSVHHQVQIYVPVGVLLNVEKLKVGVISALVEALAGRLLRLWPQHRWLGAEAAIDDLALIEACHGLASAAFHHLCHGQIPLHPPGVGQPHGSRSAAKTQTYSSHSRGSLRS